MPSQFPSPLLRRVAAAIAIAAPEDALRAALEVARELGVVPTAEGGAGSVPWVTLTGEARTLELDLAEGTTLDDAARATLSDLLRVAFARACEHEQLQRTRERMALLSSASFEGLFFHIDGVLFDANERLCEMVGYERGEILGDQLMQRCVAPEDRPSVLQRLATSYEGTSIVTAMRKDGSRFRAEIQAKQGALGDRPVRVVAVRDVTERERHQALLRESEERLRNLAETAFDMNALSRDGVIIDVTGASERVLGYTREQLIGREIMSFVAAPAAPHIGRALTEQRPGVFQSVVLSASGEQVPLEIVAVNTTLHGEPVRLSAMRDLRETERRDRERRDLEHMLELSQRRESLGVLAGGIAHDFNNLLTVVLGNAELLRRRLHDSADQSLVGDIAAAAGRAATLTAQMLAYAGRAELGPRAPIDLGASLQELRTLLGATLSKKAVISIDACEQSVVLGNRATLTQLLMNLLTNASDALGADKGTISIRTRRLSDPDARFANALGGPLGAAPYLLLEVSDTGIGMDPAIQARIFEPFFTTKSTGHGLGLAATVGIVAAHGGLIRVESEPGHGSTFAVLLPAQVTGTADTARTVEVSPRRTRSVLVVDDERLLRSNLRALLEESGYEVREADSGKAALEALAQEEPGVVLLDMSMPDLSGLEVLRRIRESGSQVPVILSSGYHDAALELEAGSYQGFLCKPYSLDELLEALGGSDRAGP